MQRGRLILLGLFVLAGAVLMSLAGARFLDNKVELYYRAPSWDVDSVLPLELPPATRNIRMLYDVKRQLGFGVCELSGVEQARLAASLNPVASEEMVYLAADTAKRMRSSPSWWPRQMLDRLSEGKMMFLRSQDYFYAVSEEKVFFWRKTASEGRGYRS